MPNRIRSLFLAAAITLAAPVCVQAADRPAEAGAQVKSDLYVTATEAWALMQADPSVVLVDVRDPVEAMFTGFASDTDIHVPYMMADRSSLNAEKGTFAMKVNLSFVTEMEARLAALGADRATTKVIFMCRSGSTRSAPAADLLHDRGWARTYTMVDGFEGNTRKDGPSKGVRDVDGWRNAGLPWSYRLPSGVVYVAAP